jgi:hypothetical protein
MPIDPLTEETFPLAQAARRLPRLRNNRPVHVSTLWRWALSGLRGVRLETALVGGVRVTSNDALRRFFAALNDVPAPANRRPDEEVEKKLDDIGIR